ncbi:MAG TPA: serpin family protein [Ilumatobacteraceae bacterium]|nr:serpin family protein [Ilumatobacteraceae bacterium]
MRRVLGIVLITVTVAACGSSDDAAGPATVPTDPPPPTASSADAFAVSDGVGRAPLREGAPVADLAAGWNDAGFDLLRRLSTSADGENVVFSPLSIGHALLMAAAAADDPTRTAIETAFGLPDGAHDAWNTIDQTIAADQSDQVTVTLADRIWPRTGLQPDQAWIDLLATNHGADVVPLDFAGDTEGSRAAINDWVSDRTEGLIADLLPAGFVEPSTVLVLTNTVYFAADWQLPFGKYGTIDSEFTRLDGSTVATSFMRELELGDRRGAGDGFVGAELPYADGDYSMLVLVPDEGRFDELVGRLDQALLDEIDTTFTTGPYELLLPKWADDTTVDLRSWLEEIGAAPGSYPGISPDAFLDAAVHAADITVDEQGTVAAAATALGFAESGPPEPELTVAADRPFLYLIRHRETGVVMFAGQVVDPT